MILLVGAMLGAGVLLVLSPWLWPARPAATAPAEPSALARLIGEAGFAERARPRTVLASAVLVAFLADLVPFCAHFGLNLGPPGAHVRAFSGCTFASFGLLLVYCWCSFSLASSPPLLAF